MTPTFFESLKRYVGFTEASSAALRELHPLVQPSFVPIVDDFYAAIEAHPSASAAITGGTAQIERLKQTLVRWLDSMLLGPHDEAYYQARARIGRVHVRIDLPQGFMFTAMNRIRVLLLDVVRDQLIDNPAALQRASTALHQILDLELAIMLETYREDLVVKSRGAERLATIGQFAASSGIPSGSWNRRCFFCASTCRRRRLPSPVSPNILIESAARSPARTRRFTIFSILPATDRRTFERRRFVDSSKARPRRRSSRYWSTSR